MQHFRVGVLEIEIGHNRVMKAFYSDHFVLPLPEGHRFPMAKYQLLRDRLEPGSRVVTTDTVGSTSIGDALFTGDTMFMPDYGSARCDFPGGDARTLYRSINQVLSLPAETRLYMCHDYPPEGREPQCVTTVAEQKKANVHVHQGVSEAEFVAMRDKRDATLSMPVLILPSVQINMRAGQLPPPEDNGQRYLKIPVDAL